MGLPILGETERRLALSLALSRERGFATGLRRCCEATSGLWTSLYAHPCKYPRTIHCPWAGNLLSAHLIATACAGAGEMLCRASQIYAVVGTLIPLHALTGSL
ncbi:uncharacterized protein PHACADRAFT_265223 [Phanerochaete carnosa HHB-10118-sp]|uniref:Uncharacterized protein n=1 Tax=Phanerochaete carnosa (strain HHB-10118-sp) TaxID=650164 RepID=K5VEQ3_PHACS|nr:uncharacterized protein PHACADRAFT_265223 [Phanerochaete carnosa HHB-10118-sp]EKM49653.1 hypothetical protein PHACADRAFT_265223 [Phanerochaete carnosa HHB-10118-sp]